MSVSILADTIPGLPYEPNRDLGESQNLVTKVLKPVGGWDESIVPVLDHICYNPKRERLGVVGR